MAKTSKEVRNQQRIEMADKFRAKREELRTRSKNMNLTLEERMEARVALTQLPRNSARNRIRNRCKITGRPRGYVGRIGVSRVALRKLAHEGVLPGLSKASW